LQPRAEPGALGFKALICGSEIAGLSRKFQDSNPEIFLHSYCINVWNQEL
jgi:hypothetical protein